MSLITDFKKFLLRGNVVDLAVAVVIATAFAAVVKAGSHFLYGDFINALITFVSVAAAVFYFVVMPVNLLMSRRAQEDPDTKECPECTSAIPIRARRCPMCTAPLDAGTRPGTA